VHKLQADNLVWINSLSMCKNILVLLRGLLICYLSR